MAAAFGRQGDGVGFFFCALSGLVMGFESAPAYGPSVPSVWPCTRAHTRGTAVGTSPGRRSALSRLSPPHRELAAQGFYVGSLELGPSRPIQVPPGTRSPHRMCNRAWIDAPHMLHQNHPHHCMVTGTRPHAAWHLQLSCRPFCVCVLPPLPASYPSGSVSCG